MSFAAPLDLGCLPDFVWPEKLRPIGEGTFEKEGFEAWWGRNAEELKHLPAELCEQWIYRHWEHSPFAFLPLDTLDWRKELWSGERFLKSTYRAWGGKLCPKFDYDALQGEGNSPRLPTAVALDSGTWDYPVVLLSTPTGVIDNGIRKPEVRFVLVEGHQRHRYLNALHELGRPPLGPHEVIILTATL